MEHDAPVALVLASWTRTKIRRALESRSRGAICRVVIGRDRSPRPLRRTVQPVGMAMKGVPVSVEHDRAAHQRQDRFAAARHAAIPQLKRTAIFRLPVAA